MIRPARVDEVTDVASIAIASTMFAADDRPFLEELLADAVGADDREVLVTQLDGLVVGMTYYQPRPAADRVWDLTMIAVHPGQQGQGNGAELMRHVEADLTARGQRLLVVETSATPQYDLTRRFYQNLGYREEARIQDYWADGDDLVVFTKRLGQL